MISPWKQAKIRRVFSAIQNYFKTAMECDVDPKTVHKYTDQQSAAKPMDRPQRTYKTRVAADFETLWPEIEELLKENHDLKPYAILEHMIDKHKDAFSPSWKRTLERRVAHWKIAHGIEKEVFFSQIHKPGDVLAIDFTDMSKLAVRIGTELMDHNFLAFHAVLTYSNWEYAEHCRSESFEALASGVQNAFHSLGGVTARLRFDSMSAAVNNLSSDHEFRTNWKNLLDHFGTKGHRINVRSPEENGDCESSHGHLKDYVDQRLMLRGNRNFENFEQWQEFLSQCIASRNKKRSSQLAQDREQLEAFPKTFFPVFTTLDSTVKSNCVLRIKQNDYAVPSCFIGKKVHLRIYSDRIELWYAGNKKLDMPRLIGKKLVFFDFRHVIDTLVRKPGAFANYQFRQELYPTQNFRLAFDVACAQQGERDGIRTYLKLLYLAKHVGLEAVEQELAHALASNVDIDAKAIEANLKATSTIPESFHAVDPEVETPDLDDYNSLLEHKEVLDEPTEPEPCDRELTQATEPIGTGWPFEEASFANDANDSDSTGRTSCEGALELPGVPERTDGPRMPQANREPHCEAPKKVITGHEQSVVGNSMESTTDDSTAAHATTANGRVPIEGGEYSDFWTARLGENDVAQCVGGPTRSSGAHGLACTVRETCSTLVTCEAGATTSTVAFEDWSILGIDHRRSWICSAEPRGDGSALHVDSRPLREDEYSAQFEPSVFEMGADLQGSDDHRRSDRSTCSSQHNYRAERTERTSRGSESEPRETATSGRGYPVIAHWKNEQFQSGNLVVAKVEF
jgi:hypothetical protein